MKTKFLFLLCFWVSGLCIYAQTIPFGYIPYGGPGNTAIYDDGFMRDSATGTTHIHRYPDSATTTGFIAADSVLPFGLPSTVLYWIDTAKQQYYFSGALNIAQRLDAGPIDPNHYSDTIGLHGINMLIDEAHESMANLDLAHDHISLHLQGPETHGFTQIQNNIFGYSKMEIEFADYIGNKSNVNLKLHEAALAHFDSANNNIAVVLTDKVTFNRNGSVLNFPASDGGMSGAVLKTDGMGNLSFGLPNGLAAPLRLLNGTDDGSTIDWGTCIAGANSMPDSSISFLSVSSKAVGNIAVAGISRQDNSTNIGGYFHGDGSFMNSDSCSGNMGVSGYATGKGYSPSQADWILNIGVHGETKGSSTHSIGGNFYSTNENCAGANFGVVAGASGGSTGIVGLYADCYSGSCSITDSIGTSSGANVPAMFAAYFNGNTFTAGNVYLASDENFKQNIKSVKNASDMLAKLSVKTYTFNQAKYPSLNFQKGTHYGVMAQEVEKVLPSLVLNTKTVAPMRKNVQPETYNIKAVNYNEFIPLLIAAHNELKEDLVQKEKQIETLEKQIADIRSMVNEICTNGCDNLRNTGYGNIDDAQQKDMLFQSIPNPTSADTKIGYYIASKFSTAFIMLTDMNGTAVQQYKIDGLGSGSITISAGTLSAGMYKYSLLIDGKLIATKGMTVVKN